MSTLRTNFIKHYTNQCKDLCKKHKDLNVLTEEDILTLFKFINKYTLVNILTDNKDVHIFLLLVILAITEIANKQKYKAKEMEKLYEYYQYFKNLEYINDKDAVEKVYTSHPYYPLFTNELYAKRSIDKYLELIISKSVDFIPHNDKRVKLFNMLLDQIDYHRDWLLSIVEEGCYLWVYNITENNQYLTFTLNSLNQEGRLGDIIRENIDKGYGKKLIDIAKDRGYEIYAGWGDLIRSSDVSEQDMPKDISDKKVITPSLMDKAVHDAHMYSFMYYDNNQFDACQENYNFVYESTIALALYHHFHDYDVTVGTFKTVVNKLKAQAKATKVFKKRRDRKYWYTDGMAQMLYNKFMKIKQDNTLVTLILVSSHAFDVATTSNDDFEKSIDAHHAFLSRTFKYIWIDNCDMFKDKINGFITAYRDVYMPIYRTLIPEGRRWILLSSLEYVVNMRDITKCDTMFGDIVEWFSIRRSAEYHQDMFARYKCYLELLGVNNKKYLKEKLEKRDFNFVSYNNSKQVYQDIITLLDNDINRHDAIVKSDE